MTDDELYPILYSIGNTLERIAKALEANELRPGQMPPLQSPLQPYIPPAVVAAAVVNDNPPIHHDKPMRRNSRGWFCATRLADGTWCAYKPSQPVQNGPYAPQGQGVASQSTGELP